MKPLSEEESDRRVTLALHGRDDDGESVAENPVVGLRVLPDGPSNAGRKDEENANE